MYKPPPSVPKGITLYKNPVDMSYSIVIKSELLHTMAHHDPWNFVIAEAVHKYEGEIRRETLEKMPIEDLETLAQMIIHEMDKR